MTETRNPNQQDIEKDIAKYADLMRAGLLDHDPELKAQVETALVAAPDTITLWHTIREELEHHSTDESAISHRLRTGRREALRRAGHGRSPWIVWPQWATATACALALVAGVAWYLTGDPLTPATPQVALEDVPELQELTENLDFYAWLDNQHASASTQGPR